jgi:hypothetical protein
MTATTTPAFRYIGVTDECIECQKCGKADLKSTVVLAILDADGNPEEVTYYGSTCAARALSARGMRVKGGGREILQSARWAMDRLKAAVEDCRKVLAAYGLPETGEIDQVALIRAGMRFAEIHRHAAWAPGLRPCDWERRVLEMVDRRRAVLAEGALVGL